MLDADALERAQEAKRKEFDASERFIKKYEGRYIRTPFTNEEHVSAIVMVVQCHAGDYQQGWFKYTPHGMSTHDIMDHNANCDPAERINQYIIFGFNNSVSMRDINEIDNELSMLAITY